MSAVKSNLKSKPSAPRATGSGPRHPRGSVRDAFLASALKIILKDGPGALTIRAAADAAVPPMSYEAPRRHFKSRKEVLTHLAEEGFAEMGRRFEALGVAYSKNPLEHLVQLGMAYVEFAGKFPAHFRVMLDLRDRTKRMVAMRHDALQHLERCVAALNPEMAPEIRRSITATCWSIVHGLSALHNDRGFVEAGIAPNTFAATRRQITAQVLGVVTIGVLASSGVGASPGDS